MTKAVKALLFATVGAYVVQVFAADAMGVEHFLVRVRGRLITETISRYDILFGLSCDAFRQLRLWQLVSYMFLHGGLWHLFLNMFTLGALGPETERALGSARFVALYFISGIAGGAGWLVVTACGGGGSAYCIGASGAVLGVLAAFAAVFPSRRLVLLFFPFPMKARTVAVLMAALTLLSLPDKGRGGVAHAAHLFGGVAGYAFASLAMHGRRRSGDDPADVLQGFSWEAGERWHRLSSSVADDVDSGRRPGWTDHTASADEVRKVLTKLSERGIESLSDEERDVLGRSAGQGHN